MKKREAQVRNIRYSLREEWANVGPGGDPRVVVKETKANFRWSAEGHWLHLVEHGLRPGTVNTRVLDPACGPQVRIETAHAPVRIALSNSFGFGGNNCVLVFGDPGAGGSR